MQNNVLEFWLSKKNYIFVLFSVVFDFEIFLKSYPQIAKNCVSNKAVFGHNLKPQNTLISCIKGFGIFPGYSLFVCLYTLSKKACIPNFYSRLNTLIHIT